MSLPQRKKTPEEIAKLREELGIPGGPTPPSSSPAAEPAAEVPAAPAETIIYEEETTTPPEEVIPAPAAEIEPPIPEPVAPEPELTAPAPASGPKPVRSLRKSERIPSSRPISSSPISSTLPTQRRTEKELSMIRRSQPFTTTAVAHLVAQTAHPFFVGLGYVLVISAIAMPILDWKLFDVPFFIPAILSAGSLAVALFIFLKKKRSLHHAGFITAIALLVIVFGALYYFPQLRNAS